MSCDNCNQIDNIYDLYECSYCRSYLCNSCSKINKNILCKICNNKFIQGEIKEYDFYSWLTKCEKCGNIWDGNAQCNCWEYDFSLAFNSYTDTDNDNDTDNDTDNDNEIKNNNIENVF